MIKEILIVEDEESINRGISLKLTKEGYKVYSAETIEKAAELFNLYQNTLALIICDVGLPDGSGLVFCKKVRNKSDVLFLFLTALDTEIDIVSGYDMGADDYITKPFSLMVLISKVNALIRRTDDKKLDRIVSGDISINLKEKRVQKNGEFMALTPNEWKLLELFMKNPKCIISKNQILDSLWDINSEYIDENAIAVNIHRLKQKLGCSNYITNIRGMGYIWDRECSCE